MDARETVEAYYDALRDGRPLGPFFAGTDATGDDDDGAGDDADPPVKFGISETLVGVDAIRDGLAGQTETTTDWTVESRALRVTERDDHAWFADEVVLAWTDVDQSNRVEFETRWSGTLEARPGAVRAGSGSPTVESPWRFVGMHVSTADAL